ncbi:MAG: tRNA uridine-5-carboxymethylaminomethyl(34) synthesis GTPase MnmE [Bacteroidaceae bacterium]|nr:tRNA uridine-5-carboxymethylaminomethyl(34) synthesis GTPase MnmE [Bacteroidaceae bacterium]
MNDTICALATPPGGAIAVIRVSGRDAVSVTNAIFSKSLDHAEGYTIHFGQVADEKGVVLDDVLVSVFRAPHSYTGEDSTEISCHGSAYIVQHLLESLIQHCARQAKPGEFTMRAYMNGKLDLSQAEAVADLIASSNKATHDIALSQLRGHFSSQLAQLRDQLLRLTSLLELELDFSDHEELEFADRSELRSLAQTIDTRVQQLADSFHTGNALKNGLPVAIIGAPNVGKSTLLNALVGEERAIVSDIQGTTRDAIEDTIQLAGITFRFIDTAGIRHTSDTIENLGIERSIAAVQRAQIVLMMTESGVPYPDVPLRDDQTVIRIENKTETFQAKFGIGLDALRQQLIDAAPKTSDSDVIVTSARHYEALCRAHDSLARVLDGLTSSLPSDLIAEDLRLTLDALGDITGGTITPQDTLNNIFSHFCVGK